MSQQLFGLFILYLLFWTVEPAPSLPGKKPVMPPPVGKKPVKQADPKLMAQTDDHKVKESQKGKSNDLMKCVHYTPKLALLLSYTTVTEKL